MRKTLILFVAAAFLAACEKKLPSTGTFGNEKMTAEGAVPIVDFVKDAQDGKEGKVTGKVTKVCQSQGCWFIMDMNEGKSIRIITKDHSFSLPKDASGKTAIAEGTLKMKTIDVDRQKHLAEDAGESAEEIAKITEPINEYEFETTGVIIQ